MNRFLSRLASVVALAALWVAVPAIAENGAAVGDSIEVTRGVVAAERKLVVAQNMGLTQEESEAFWPIYNDYQNELRKINDREVKLIQDYAAEYETLTDERAIELLKIAMSIDDDQLKLRRKYVKRFQKVLPTKKVVRYYQIENKLDAIVSFDLARKLPLVED